MKTKSETWQEMSDFRRNAKRAQKIAAEVARKVAEFNDGESPATPHYNNAFGAVCSRIAFGILADDDFAAMSSMPDDETVAEFLVEFAAGELSPILLVNSREAAIDEHAEQRTAENLEWTFAQQVADFNARTVQQ
jgi:hypothetical protein